MVLALHSYCGDNVKSWLTNCFKTLFSKKTTFMKKSQINDKILEKLFPVITWNKKHSPKQAASIIFTLEEKCFAAAAFEGL